MKRSNYTALLAGILLLAGLAFIGFHYGDFARFVQLLAHIDPLWIFAAALLQAATYCSLALIWYRILAVNAIHYPFIQLIPLALAKLFADQALPSGGISGIAFVIRVFKQRHVAGPVGMGVMLLSLLSFYIAYAIVAVLSFLAFWSHHDAHRWMAMVVALFMVISLVVPGALLLLTRRGERSGLPEWLARVPGIAGIVDTFKDVPDELLRKPWLVVEITAYQVLIFVLDAATLWAMLAALGDTVAPFLVFACFVIASVVSTVSLIPLGLGSFELTCVGLLVSVGVGVESAMTATLLLRGFTLWIPMIPGLLLTRRAIS